MRSLCAATKDFAASMIVAMLLLLVNKRGKPHDYVALMISPNSSQPLNVAPRRGYPEHRIVLLVELVPVTSVGANATAAIGEVDQRAGCDVMVVTPVEDWIERRATAAVHSQRHLIAPVILVGG